jgi:hypothetical protein
MPPSENQMTDSKQHRVRQLIYGIEYQYPDGVSTYSPCMKCHNHMARESGSCAQCLQHELSELIGRDDAEFLHRRIRKLHSVKMRILNGVEDDD